MAPLRSLFSLLSLLLSTIQHAESARIPSVASEGEDLVEQQLYPRRPPSACGPILTALGASSFCSSFIGLHDSTRTVTISRPTAVTTQVPAAPCTTTLATSTTTSTTTSTAPGNTEIVISTLLASTAVSTVIIPASTDLVTTVLAASSETLTISSGTVTSTVSTSTTLPLVTDTSTSTITTVTTTTVTIYPTSPAKRLRRIDEESLNLAPRQPAEAAAAVTTTCSLKGLPLPLKEFACDVISAACSEFVHAHTTTVDKTVPVTHTKTKTAHPSCVTKTPDASTVVTTVFFTPAPVTSTETSTPPVSISTDIVILPPTTIPVTSRPPESIFDTTVPATTSTTTTTITIPASTTTTKVTTTSTSTVTSTHTGTPYGTNDCVNGKQIPVQVPGLTAYFVEYCGQRVTQIYTFGSRTESSFSACLNYCMNSACDAVNYNIGTGECVLSDGAFGTVSPDGSFDASVLVIQ